MNEEPELFQSQYKNDKPAYEQMLNINTRSVTANTVKTSPHTQGKLTAAHSQVSARMWRKYPPYAPLVH